MVSRALLVVYNFYVGDLLSNAISALLIFKKNILKITSNLVSAIKKVSWKDLGLPPLFST